MKVGREQELILRSVQKYNILPITSVCNAACLFCSHRQNPKGVQVYWINHRSLEQVKEAMEFLSGDRKIVIGESATKIIEGEPFCHPEIGKILEMLRKKFKSAPLQITTNGTGLTAENVRLIAELEPIELYISLNSVNPAGRKILMGNDDAEKVIQGIELLAKYKINFHGSIVAMPHVVGWKDLEETILFLADRGALTIRVFFPGFTSLAPPELRFSPTLQNELASFVEGLSEQTAVPIILEPQKLSDLDPVVEGVIPNTPAQHIGLRKGDKIIEINGKKPRCRVEAFNFLSLKRDCQLIWKRGDELFSSTLKHDKDERVGVVMAYDLLPEFWGELKRIIQRHESQRTLLLVSPLAENLIRAAVNSDKFLKAVCSIQPVASCFFGGSIGAAGLLVVADFMAALDNYKGLRPDLLVLPARAFDDWGRDLCGQSYLFIEEEKGIPVELLEA
ncbi:MAG TPA: radical SAM protein [Clostridia bacterium]|jgi:pyruvate-formate lyase-activating enzyme|nr:radical SAM protein [Clostridia bacterium]